MKGIYHVWLPYPICTLWTDWTSAVVHRTPDKMRHRLKGFSAQMYKKESHSKLHLHLCILFKMREEEITKGDSSLDWIWLSGWLGEEGDRRNRGCYWTSHLLGQHYKNASLVFAFQLCKAPLNTNFLSLIARKTSRVVGGTRKPWKISFNHPWRDSSKLLAYPKQRENLSSHLAN